jgi:hypothetical protein
MTTFDNDITQTRTKIIIVIMKNQPPDSDVRWQHESQICFATFI